MTNKFVNNFTTSLSAALSSVATVVSVASTNGLPALANGDTILMTLFRLSGVTEVGHEVIRVTGINGLLLTVVRGVEGAAPSAFAIGDQISLRATAGIFQQLSDHAAGVGNLHGMTKADIGLGNVDNTADINLPISNATQAALNAKADASSVSNVNNTSDANKPISTATQAALDNKADVGGSSPSSGGSTNTGFTMVNGVITQLVEVIKAVTYTTNYTYNPNGTVNTATATGGGKTRTETYTYSNGVSTGFTATEI